MRMTATVLGLAASMAFAPAAFADTPQSIDPATGATNYGTMNNEPTTHEQPRTIGHGVRDTTKAIGHGARDFFRGIGDGWSSAKD